MSAPVALTRAVGANDRLGRLLEERGVPWLEWPAVAFEPLRNHPDVLCGSTALAFVSPTAVMMSRGLRWPAVPRIAQGVGTAEALAIVGDRADVVADPPDAEGLAAAVMATVPPGRVGLLQGDHTLGLAPKRLREAGYEVRAVTVYENREPNDLARPEQPLRAVVYASPTAVRRLIDANPWLATVPAIAIGGTTARELADHPFVRVAAEPTAEALLAAILELP